MPGPIASFIWLFGTALELTFVVCSVARKSFLRYFFLNLYFLGAIATDAVRYFMLAHFGLYSREYKFGYYSTDVLLTLALYLALISMYSIIFGELQFGKYVRLTAILLLLGTALFSYAVVAQSSERLATDFAYQLSQNLYFVGLVLTYVLWGAILKLRETRTRVVQFVLALGIYFSAYAASYAFYNLASKFGLISFLGPALGCLLPLAWTFTMWKHSEDSRLVTARLVAVPR